MSEHFGATNGVKQGSALSPILFTLCLDNLIAELEHNSDGCRIDMKYFRMVRFADDLNYFSPSLLGLQECSIYEKLFYLFLMQRRFCKLSFIMCSM